MYLNESTSGHTKEHLDDIPLHSCTDVDSPILLWLVEDLHGVLQMTVKIYTDGGCRGNPGIGGWGVFIDHDGGSEYNGFAENTTNNQMELTAAIMGLLHAPSDVDILLHTDSQYVIKGITEWHKGWIRNNWKNSKGQPVANRELWNQLISFTSPRVRWQWVKGHNGHPGNEAVDALCNQAMDAGRCTANGRSHVCDHT